MPSAALTNIAEHLDAVLHIALLTRDQPVAVIDPEHSLEELYKHRLPCLTQGERGRCGYSKEL